MLKDTVNSWYDSTVEKQKAEGYIVLERGLATRGSDMRPLTMTWRGADKGAGPAKRETTPFLPTLRIHLPAKRDQVLRGSG
jgi:hypothetical protein